MNYNDYFNIGKYQVAESTLPEISFDVPFVTFDKCDCHGVRVYPYGPVSVRIQDVLANVTNTVIGTPVASLDELKEAIALGGDITITEDIALTEKLTFSSETPTVLHLAGNTINVQKKQDINNGTELVLTGGTIVNTTNSFDVLNGSSVTVENCVITQDKTAKAGTSAFYLDNDNSSLVLKNVTINMDTAGYAITTNASTPANGMNITLDNVNIICNNETYTNLLINQPVEFVAKDCIFEGCTTAAMLRGGNYEFTNCKFIQKLSSVETGEPYSEEVHAEYKWSTKYTDGNWGSGTNIPLAVVTMGNRSASAYRYPTNVNMVNCEVSVNPVVETFSDKSLIMPAIYAYANQEEGMGVNFTYDAATKIVGEQKYESANIVVNGKFPEIFDEAQLEEVFGIGGDVKLHNDIELTKMQNITAPINLDLNGHTISNKANIPSYNENASAAKHALVPRKDTVISNGTVESGFMGIVSASPSCVLENVTVNADVYALSNAGTGTMTIKSGTYTGGLSTAVQCELGKVIIEGGEFKASQAEKDVKEGKDFTINCKDNVFYTDYKAASKDAVYNGKRPVDFIEIKGGRFYKFDPANAYTEPYAINGTPVEGVTKESYEVDGVTKYKGRCSFVAEGYKSVLDGEWFEVVPE